MLKFRLPSHLLLCLIVLLGVSACAQEAAWRSQYRYNRDPKVMEALKSGTGERWKQQAKAMICLATEHEEQCITPATYRQLLQRELASIGISAEEHGDQLRWRVPVLADGGTTGGQPLLAGVDALTALLIRHHFVGVDITGHGNPGEGRHAKSWARAYAGELMQRGIAPERLMVESAGSTEPLASTQIADGRRLNRRLEMRLLLP